MYSPLGVGGGAREKRIPKFHIKPLILPDVYASPRDKTVKPQNCESANGKIER